MRIRDVALRTPETMNDMFHSFFSSLAWSEYLSVFFFCLFVFSLFFFLFFVFFFAFWGFFFFLFFGFFFFFFLLTLTRSGLLIGIR